MVAIASRARALSATTIATTITAAAGLIAALALAPPRGAPAASCSLGGPDRADDGMQLSARWVTRAGGEHVVIEIAAPEAAAPARPPRSVAIVIDRSRSMSGEPLARARAAAARLVSRLDAGDAVAVIAYSDTDATLAPMQRAGAAHKAAALRAIAELAVDNGTCLSCGLAAGGEWLARTPLAGGVRRMVLLSDGYANLGVRDRDDLVALAAATAARGASITAVGVGLDFDEETLMRIAEVGRGNYYYVEDAGGLDAAFEREVAALGSTLATDARLVLQAAPGVAIRTALGHPLIAAGGEVAIPIADLAAGEVRRIVVETAGAPAAGACGLAARLTWRRPSDGAGRVAVARAAPGGAAAAGVVEQALAGAALAAAADAVDRSGAAAARASLLGYVAALDGRPAIERPAHRAIRVRLDAAIAALGAAAAGGDAAAAVKLARELGRGLQR